MKKMTDPISGWTLKECINALKRMDADLLEYGYAIYIADRIEQLTTKHQFISDGKGTSITKCICGKEKWEHV